MDRLNNVIDKFIINTNELIDFGKSVGIEVSENEDNIDNRKNALVVWSVGTTIQYCMKLYDIENKVINKKLLKRLKLHYKNIINIICVKDENEKEQFMRLIAKNKIDKDIYLFIPYGADLDYVYRAINNQFNNYDYLDSARYRIDKVANVVGIDNCYHISEFLD